MREGTSTETATNHARREKAFQNLSKVVCKREKTRGSKLDWLNACYNVLAIVNENTKCVDDEAQDGSKILRKRSKYIKCSIRVTMKFHSQARSLETEHRCENHSNSIHLRFHHLSNGELKMPAWLVHVNTSAKRKPKLLRDRRFSMSSTAGDPTRGIPPHGSCCSIKTRVQG